MKCSNFNSVAKNFVLLYNYNLTGFWISRHFGETRKTTDKLNAVCFGRKIISVNPPTHCNKKKKKKVSYFVKLLYDWSVSVLFCIIVLQSGYENSQAISLLLYNLLCYAVVCFHSQLWISTSPVLYFQKYSLVRPHAILSQIFFSYFRLQYAKLQQGFSLCHGTIYPVCIKM